MSASGRLVKELITGLDQMPSWPRVRFILETLKQGGYPAYLVGGAVRDLMLGQVPVDADVLTSATPDDLSGLFPDQTVRHVGKSFGITLVDGVEVAGCRPVCTPNGKSGKGFPEKDLGRRDLTVNSMALDLFSGSLVDPFGGQADLAGRRIRFTQDPLDRIKEDPLRMVRACRFAGQLDGSIEKKSLDAIRCQGHVLADGIAPERIRAELLKAMAMARPSRFFTHLHQTGLLGQILPCLDQCHDLDGGPYHGETVFEHCLLVGDALPAGQPLLRLAGFLHDVGKFDAAIVKDGHLSFAGHETHDTAIARDLDQLRFSRQETGYILSLFRAHMRPLTHDTTPKAVRRLLAMLGDLNLDYRDFLRLRIADKKGNLAKSPYTLSEIRVRLAKILAEHAPENAFHINDLALTGREICNLLAIGPGPRVGRIKQHLFEQVLADPSLNTPAHLARLIRNFKP